MDTTEIEKVNVHDSKYCISYPLEDDLLLSSIKRFGILIPLCLLDVDPPTVVTGFKRLRAAEKLGIRKIPYVLLNVSDRQALLTAINDNLKRPLNTVEKALCVEKMFTAALPAEEIYGVMKVLGLPPKHKILKTAVAAAAAGETVKNFLVRQNLPMTAVEDFFWFSPEEQTSIIRLATPLNPSVSHLREVLELMMLVKVKLGDIDFERLGGVADIDELKQTLKKQTHPGLSAMEEKLAHIRKAASLPPNIKVKVDPFFEKESIDIWIRARNSREIEEALTKLNDLSKKDIFGSIFELTYGTSGRN
jgi:ParB family chromosome partitioning protein